MFGYFYDKGDLVYRIYKDTEDNDFAICTEEENATYLCNLLNKSK